jgi:hypothetical protein
MVKDTATAKGFFSTTEGTEDTDGLTETACPELAEGRQRRRNLECGGSVPLSLVAERRLSPFVFRFRRRQLPKTSCQLPAFYQ